MPAATPEPSKGHTVPRTFRIMRRGHFIEMLDSVKRELESVDSDVRNTESIHLWAVAHVTASDADGGALGGWLAMLVSLGVILTQHYALILVLYQSSYPSCSAHTECRVGEMCLPPGVYNIPRSRCMDCSYCSKSTPASL